MDSFHPAFERLQELIVLNQNQCEHKNFVHGICSECDWACEHSNKEDFHCLDCGEYLPPEDEREPEDFEVIS